MEINASKQRDEQYRECVDEDVSPCIIKVLINWSIKNWKKKKKIARKLNRTL